MLTHYGLFSVIPLDFEPGTPLMHGSVVLVLLLAVNLQVGLMLVKVVKVVVQVSALDVVARLVVASRVNCVGKLLVHILLLSNVGFSVFD